MKRKFNKDFLKNELDLPYSAIKDTITDNSRWSISHEIVFEYEGRHWMTWYSCGATECQDESPWEYDDEVECVEVVLKNVLVKKWVQKKDGE